MPCSGNWRTRCHERLPGNFKMEQVETREAREADWPALEMIFHTNRADGAGWLDPNRPKDDLRQQSDGEEIRVAEIGGKVVGFLSVWEPESFIHHLYVDVSHQRAGIGKKLLSEALERYAKPMRLKCVAENRAALEFYFRSGWKEVGRGESDEGLYLLLECPPGLPPKPTPLGEVEKSGVDRLAPVRHQGSVFSAARHI